MHLAIKLWADQRKAKLQATTLILRQAVTLRELFFKRLECVWRLVKASRPKARESPNDAQRRFHTNHLRKLAAQRPHMGRQMVGVSTKKFMKYR